MSPLPPEPAIRFDSIYRAAPLPAPADRGAVHPDANPLCAPMVEATGLGSLILSPVDIDLWWAAPDTGSGMVLVRFPRLHSPQDHGIWQEPDEAGDVYPPAALTVFDHLDETRRAALGDVVDPATGWPMIAQKLGKPRLAGHVEFTTGIIAHPAPGWGFLVCAPFNVPTTGFAAYPGVHRSFFRSFVPTVIRLLRPNATVSIRRGQPLATLLPLPETVLRATAIDPREHAAGIGEWRDDTFEEFLISRGTREHAEHPGRYRAAVGRYDRTGGDYPYPRHQVAEATA